MKILLLTDIPPNKTLTAGLVLDQLVRFLPPGSMACFAAINPMLDVEMSEDLEFPVYYADKPAEMGFAKPGRRRLPGRVGTFLKEKYHEAVNVPRLIDQAVAFGREQKADAVWAVLQGQTMVRMALPVAERLRVPLYTHVWDPLSWWLKAHCVDPLTSRALVRQFDKTMRQSRACAAASWAMADAYSKKYGVPTVPVIASHDRSNALQPSPCIEGSDDLVIGMAGQFYALQEWHQLIAALKAVGWRISGRRVLLKVLGHYVPTSDVPAGHLEFMGWKSQREVIDILSQADLLYCPYPFETSMEEVSRLSFPSKLVTYLAAGRPILFYGPAYSSPARYLDQRDAAFLATSPTASALVNELRRAIENPERYAAIAKNGQLAFQADFTLERMQDCLFTFLGTSQEALLAAHPESALQGDRITYKRARKWAAPPSRFSRALATGNRFAHRVARYAALRVPPIRAMWHYAHLMREERDALAAKVSALEAELGEIQARFAELRARVAVGTESSPLEELQQAKKVASLSSVR